jgi:nucleoside-diphosphate-sugar epimerase
MILVTGATGLVGSEVCRQLSKRSIAFKGLKRAKSDVGLCHDINIVWTEGDVLDVLAVDEMLKGVHTVIHCAAMVSFDHKDSNRMMQVNVTGTQNMINGCLENNVLNFIHVSSIAALGRNKEEKVVTELTNWVDTPLNTAYAKSKYLSEIEVWRGESEGLNVAVVNPSVVLASGDGKKSSSKLLQFVWEEHLFYIDKQLNYVDVRDVGNAILKILDKSNWGQRYILNQGVISYSLLFKILSQKLDKKQPKWKISKRYLAMGVLLTKMWSLLSNKPPLLSRELAKTLKEDFVYSNEKIKAELEFQFIEADESFDWVCREFLTMKTVA